MAEDLIRYGMLVENALRGVVRDALRVVAKMGRPGDHHFYITCRTTHPGFVLPDYLQERHPEEITLVLQHQVWDLEVGAESFDVTLAFGGRRARLHIPFGSIMAFVDPSVDFGLQFKPAQGAQNAASPVPAGSDAPPTGAPAPEPPGEKVVQLDAFRRT